MKLGHNLCCWCPGSCGQATSSRDTDYTGWTGLCLGQVLISTRFSVGRSAGNFISFEKLWKRESDVSCVCSNFSTSLKSNTNAFTVEPRNVPHLSCWNPAIPMLKPHCLPAHCALFDVNGTKYMASGHDIQYPEKGCTCMCIEAIVSHSIQGPFSIYCNHNVFSHCLRPCSATLGQQARPDLITWFDKKKRSFVICTNNGF